MWFHIHVKGLTVIEIFPINATGVCLTRALQKHTSCPVQTSAGGPNYGGHLDGDPE